MQILYTPLVEVELYGVKGFKHQHMPLVAPNFVYLDGPALTCERQVAMDLLDLEPCFPPDFFLVIDDRKVNTAFLRAHFTRRYKFRRRTYRGANATFELLHFPRRIRTHPAQRCGPGAASVHLSCLGDSS